MQFFTSKVILWHKNCKFTDFRKLIRSMLTIKHNGHDVISDISLEFCVKKRVNGALNYI